MTDKASSSTLRGVRGRDYKLHRWAAVLRPRTSITTASWTWWWPTTTTRRCYCTTVGEMEPTFFLQGGWNEEQSGRHGSAPKAYRWRDYADPRGSRWRQLSF